MNFPMKVYHELRKVSPERARMLVRKVLEQNGGNVSKTARILSISRHTGKARDGSLHDLSRALYHIPLPLHMNRLTASFTITQPHERRVSICTKRPRSRMDGVRHHLLHPPRKVADVAGCC